MLMHGMTITEQFLLQAPTQDKDLVQGILQRLMERYNEPHRHYHNVRHLEAGLTAYSELFDNPLPAAEFFAWMYHDCVYDSTASDNEKQSTLVWMHDAPALGLGVFDIARGVDFILATDPSAEPISVLNDMDLAELGSNPERFNQNTDDIRLEYGWVSDEVWKKGRTGILRQFLQRPQLYLTKPFQEKYTAQAIENLKNALIRLS